MIEHYVDLENLNICSAVYLTGRKHPSLIVKNLKDYPLTDDDLSRLGAARLDDSAPAGYRATGKAVKVGQTYYREYVDQTPEGAAAQRLSELAATDSDMPRVVEDLIATLVSLGVISETDLPAGAQAKLADRKAKRAAL